jgi:hypothetical protein
MSWGIFNRRLRSRIEVGDYPGWLQRHPRQRRVVTVILSTPPWVDHDTLRSIYAEAKRRTKTTGVKHVVDHVIPVCHPAVCGLTVPDNLRVVPERSNQARGNRWHPDQIELFPEFELV